MSYLSGNYLAPWGLSVAPQFLWELLETELVEWLNLIYFHVCIDSRIKILLGKLPWWHFSKYCIYACSLIVFLLAISVNLSSRDVWPPVLSYLRLTSTLPPFPNPFKIWRPISSFFFPVLGYWELHPWIPLKLTSWSWWLLIVLPVDFSITCFTGTFRQIFQQPPLKKGSVIWIYLKVLAMSMDAKPSFTFSVIALFSLSAVLQLYVSDLWILWQTSWSWCTKKKKTPKNQTKTKPQTPLQVISQTFLACLIAFFHLVWQSFIFFFIVLIKTPTSVFLKSCFK